jgi:carbohydrate kinase (thermoresistant glucokinase family)
MLTQGSTEVGQLMTSFRPASDRDWNYVRESPKLSPFLRWVPCGPNLYECTVLPGWPAKVASNQPDGSYATKDMFEPHPSIEKAWKYIARLDDTLALVNGEKFNPVMMEGTIRSNKAVTETVVFGSGRPSLGVLVVPSPAVKDMSQTEIVDRIWPVIDEANRTAEAYARISRDMIVILPQDCEFPRTDKGSVIRQAFYKQFATEIENAYDEAATAHGELQALTLPELQSCVRDILTKILPQARDIDSSADLFSLGLDSLQSIQIRTEILKTVDIGGNKLGQNVVFDYPSIAALSAHLYGLRTGQEVEQTSIITQMNDLIERYSDFTLEKRRDVVLTGATGSLGAHVLAQLAARPDIQTVHCLVRARDNKDAEGRVRKSLSQRKLLHSLSLLERRKIHTVAADLSNPNLGLDEQTHHSIAENLTCVIHCAWSVNFNKSLVSFEKDCVAGVRHLLDLCLMAPGSTPASFDFCSSVSTVAKCPDTHTPEQLAELEWAQDMGYAQSKCVAERLCMAAAAKTGIKARVLRVGQIVADTVHGVWNDTEAIPLMMQSAITIGALPKLQESPSWTPVDVIAKAVTEISLSDAGSIVANVTNAKTFSWSNDLLPALRQAGLEFEEVEPQQWVERLRASNQDAVSNPPVKLVDFFASKYDKATFSPSRTYKTHVARSFSPTLENAPVLDPAFVKTFVKQFQASSWSPATASPPKKQLIVLAGPCGSGKSTIARRLSATFGAPFIEGDELHSPDAISRMAAGKPLEDADRAPWLDRLKQLALDQLTPDDRNRLFVSCSALKEEYRNSFRGLKCNDDNVDTVFLDLQVDGEELMRRVKGRGEHYMKEEMVESQLAIREEPGVMETDVMPMDAGKGVEEVLEDIAESLKMVGVLEGL